MTRLITAILAPLMLAATSSGIAQSADPVEELKACARMTDQDARVACFDNLGERVLRAESAGKKPTPERVVQPETATIAPAASAQPLPDDLGAPTQAVREEPTQVVAQEPTQAVTQEPTQVARQQPVNIASHGVMSSCEKDYFGYWYFYLEDGQVWKEIKRRNRRFKECNFDVTITKDMFGHMMRIEALDMEVRVRRPR